MKVLENCRQTRNECRRAAIREILEYPCDYSGECDRCHEIDALWIDNEQPGEFAFCETCWNKLARFYGREGGAK